MNTYGQILIIVIKKTFDLITNATKILLYNQVWLDYAFSNLKFSSGINFTNLMAPFSFTDKNTLNFTSMHSKKIL